ncbi:hypothetical protein T03_12440 [Trichinella britovi]|uniref:Transmembrane protein n=1 Tax=Trichinella britovi TaxID=45882 RepID=A0A0V1CEC5_TRIBR|nr:hypothetical protein T03_12440 [Trichinella britovi]
MALPSTGPEICVDSLITESTCAGFRIYHTSLVVRFAISAFGIFVEYYVSRNVLHHQHRARSYTCVSLSWLNGVTQYWSRNLCGF